MSDSKKHEPTQDDRDLNSRQHDPEHDNFWKSRGFDERPEDWRQRTASEKKGKR